ncbi:hypothetical protein ANAPRD1_01002 [Anaplasma phagocytophilum]|nr:hypothetical protein ANAPH2_00281 [Anaplasma phagocytophilum]SCV66149.1 hypothetical protein ANAPRD1_01002 [Anaplasma phagocytophilum]
MVIRSTIRAAKNHCRWECIATGPACEVTRRICIGILLRRIIGDATLNQNTISAGE